MDIYGNAIAGDSSFIPFLYQGQYYDEEIGLAGNNPNFYGYTFDSNTEVDVWGLDVYILVADSDGYYPDLQYGKSTTQYVYLRKGQIYKFGESKNAKKKDIEKVISQRVEQANIKYMLMMLMGIL